MAFGYQGKLVRLVPPEADKHLDNAYRWLNDADVTGTLLFGDRPITREAEKEWFEKAGKDPANVVFAIETLEGRHIGMSGVHQINHLHGTAITGSFIAEVNDRGKGLGTDAALTRNRYVFETLGLRMIMSEHFSGNEASARMLAKAGFLEWGRLPQAIWKNGRYLDEVKVYLTRERWLELNPPT